MYHPKEYLHTLEDKQNSRKTLRIHEIDLKNISEADVCVKIEGKGDLALVDTGASCSCMSEETHILHGSPPLKLLCNINVRSASGTNLEPIGITTCTFKLGQQDYTQNFIVCRRLTRNIILGRDFLKDNRLHMGWSKGGKFQVHAGREILVEAITTEQHLVVTMKRNITIPPRTLVVAEMQATIPDMEGSTYYDFHPTSRYEGQGINLISIPIAYHTQMVGHQILLQLLINLEEQPIKVEQGTTMGHLLDVKDTAGCIETPTVNDSVCNMEMTEENTDFLKEVIHDPNPEEKHFITSPADIDTHRENDLKDANVTKQEKRNFDDLCQEFDDVFSKSSTDIGRTPLLTMDIDTGDHPPITQRPYSLALKHVEWVQKYRKIRTSRSHN